MKRGHSVEVRPIETRFDQGFLTIHSATSTWLTLTARGTPDMRGAQHGRLLAREIETTLSTLARYAKTRTGEGWPYFKSAAMRLILPRVSDLQKRELSAIAAAAHQAGAAVDERDLLALNAWEELIEGYAVKGRRRDAPRFGCNSTFKTLGPTFEIQQECTLPREFEGIPRVLQRIQPRTGAAYITFTLPGQIRAYNGLYVSSINFALAPLSSEPGEFDRLGTPAPLRAHRAITGAAQAHQVADDFGVRAARSRGGLWLLVNLAAGRWQILDGNRQVAAVEEGALAALPPQKAIHPGTEQFVARIHGNTLTFLTRRGDAWINLSSRATMKTMKVKGTLRQSDFAGGGAWELETSGGDIYELEFDTGVTAKLEKGRVVEVEGRLVTDAMSIQMRGPRMKVTRLF